jgi:hypothetical protein
MEASNDRVFSFYHDKDRTAVRVRQVILTGPWPQTLSPAQFTNFDPRRDDDPNSTDARIRTTLIGESMFARDASTVARRALDLHGDDRYAMLLAWVLPGDTHESFRLYGEFAPTDSAPPVEGRFAGGVQGSGLLDPSPMAPALELVRTALELGKLDALADRIQKVEPKTDGDRRGRLSLLALIRMAQARDDESATLIIALRDRLETIPVDEPERRRWPELLVADRALTRPALRKGALALLDGMAASLENAPADLRDWALQVKHAQAVGKLLVLPGPPVLIGATSGRGAWASVVHMRAATRRAGNPPPLWNIQDGQVQHLPGHEDDDLYFAAPLRGDFEVCCELPTDGARAAQVVYGDFRVEIGADRKRYEIYQSGRSMKEALIEPPLDKTGDWDKFRIVVRDGSFAVTLNDRQICEQSLPANPDPWLAIHGSGQRACVLRGLAIDGGPTIPEELSLAALSDLTGWRAEYEDPSLLPEARGWRKRGEEVFGRKQPDAPGSKQEGLLRYHRPLLEDGEIRYEFYYEPGESMTHPALGRLAFLLAPDGVSLHWLTDAQHDRTGLPPDNVQVEP